MDSFFVFLMATATSALGVVLLGFFSGRIALNFRGRPLAIQRPCVWTLGLWTAGQAWADSGNALMFAAMLLCLLAWDASPPRRREPPYTL